jgi:hypothetical protein
MPTDSKPDQLIVDEVVRVLMEDMYLVDRMAHLWEILGIPYPYVQESKHQFCAGQITLHALFIKMLTAWKSKTNGRSEDLRDILYTNGFKMTAGNH